MNLINTIQSALATFAGEPSDVGARLRHVNQKLWGLGIKANYDPVGDATAPSRVLYWSTRYNARNYTVASECNGIILDYRTWQVVYRPPELPNAQFNVAVVTENWADYDIFDLNDGTVVGLYYYQDSWRISTARGIDMGAQNWCGITYKEALEAAMLQAKFPTPAETAAYAAGEIETPRSRALTWDDLDHDVSYTVGFTHPAMHFSKFLGMWIIRARVTNIGSDMPGPILDLAGFEMPQQRQVQAGAFANFQALQRVCNGHNVACWGFMLRSRAPENTGANSTVLVESRRMATVRALVYDRHMQQEAATLGVSRSALAFTTSLLNRPQRESYLQLYPEHAELQLNAMQDFEALAAQVLTGKKKDSASWFRTHLERARPLEGMTEATVLDFILNRNNLSALLTVLKPRLASL